MMRMAISCALVLAACGPAHHTGDGDDTDTTGATLSVDPPTSELVIVNGAPVSESFTVTLTYPDGHTRDVTNDPATSFGVSNGLGNFSGPQLSVASAGKGTVQALFLDKTGDAQVIVRLKDVRVDPTLDPGTPDLFTGPEDPARAPTIVYPPVGVIMPRNLGDFETHWTDAHGNDVFEVSLHTEFADVRVYVPGGNGLAAAGPMPSWTAFQASEWLAAVGSEGTVEFQVRGIQKANPTSVGSAAPQSVKLSNEPMVGGLYYWATASTTGVYGIFRHDMEKPGQPAEEFMTTNQTSGRCVACHVLSRDGSKMAITYDGGDGAATMVDVATAARAPTVAGVGWNFGTFMPDGNEFIATSKGKFYVRDYATQALIAPLATTGYATHPDMSSDGTQLVYVNTAVPGQDWHFGNGQIIVQAYDKTAHTLGPARALVADANNNYYPSWSPDGQWILFNRSTDNSGNGAYNNPSASLWVVKADGSAPPVQLAISNLAAGGLTNSWGRWAPFQQTVGTTNDPLYWITVSSKRDFGVRRRLTDDWPQIWMLAFSPAAAGAGADPGAPAFRLPFQNIDSKNHIAQWAEKVVVTQ